MRKLAGLTSMAVLIASCASASAVGPPSSERAPVDPERANRPAASVSTTSPPPAESGLEPYPGFLASAEDHPPLAAMTRGDIEVYPGPDDVDSVETLEGSTILGTVTVLAVVGDLGGDRIEVMLPGRPNGRTGWVDLDRIDLYPVDGEIIIDLSEKTLTYSSSGESLTTRVAVGSSHNPTPTGVFFVTDSVRVGNPDGPWGPHALGLSARSDTITEFNGGDGIIGIHGTNRPDSIGEAASLGCVRLPNQVITQLYELVPLGTPVVIRA
jgi:hypothetical protein